MSRKDIAPGKPEPELAQHNTQAFSSGIIKDVPASRIPDSALADGENIVIFPGYYEGRLGSTYSGELPAGRDVVVSIANGIVTLLSGLVSEDDVSNYLVVNGVRYEIIRYTDSFTFEISSSISATPFVSAQIQGKLNLWEWHTVEKRFIVMIGSAIYSVDHTMNDWRRLVCLSNQEPNNTISGFAILDNDSAIVSNSAGLFKIWLRGQNQYVYKINCHVPNVRIQDFQDGSLYEYGFIYSAARILGNGIINRLSPAVIETESGTNGADTNNRDYARIEIDYPIGPGVETFMRLTCAPLSGIYVSAEAWASIADGYFLIDVNGAVIEVFCNFTNARTMLDVAETIQTGMQAFHPFLTCSYVPASGRLIIDTGREPGSTLGYITASGSGTDISAHTAGTALAGAVVETLPINSGIVVGPLRVPQISLSGVSPEYQWHYTHFPIYRTKDKANQYKQPDKNEPWFNDPERYIWEYDLRICAAFSAARTGSVVVASVGIFEQADVGSILKWDNGDRDEITEYVNSTTVIVNGGDYYYGGDYTGYCCIGDGRVFGCSQAGTTVTAALANFSSADERKTVYFADGGKAVIVDYVSPTSVIVDVDIDRALQGLTLDPEWRNYYSAISDDVLTSRQTVLLCNNRWLSAMPNANICAASPGYLHTAVRNGSDIMYCQLIPGHEYLAGYYNILYQKNTDIRDSIQKLLITPNQIIALCTKSTWRAPTNQSQYFTIPTTATVVASIGGFDIVDDSIGCFDWGSVAEVENGKYIMITSEPGGVGIRLFDGYSFGPNLLDDHSGMSKYRRYFEQLQKATKGIYDGQSGYIVFGRA